MPDLLTGTLNLSKSIWASFWGKVSVLAAGMLLTWIVSIIPSAYARASAIYHMPEKIEDAQGLGKKLDKVIEQIQQMDYRDRTVTGTASVGDFDGEPTVQVNLLGQASSYDGMDKMRVTNLSSPDSPSLIIKIEGNFRNENPAYLIRLSRSAASKLDVKGTVKVRVEPIEQK